MSKKRPGVEAAKRLSELSDAAIWESVESQLSEVIASIDNLDNLTEFCQNLGVTLLKGENDKESKRFLSKEELLNVVKWKFSVGKPRHALMKYLNANSEGSVKENSQAAISEARAIVFKKSTKNSMQVEEIKGPLKQLTNLKGVGPATSSAMLTLVRPDLFCYMYDEVIDCFLPKRTYTLPVYLKLNAECMEIASKLEGWTTSRVAQTLWVAARVCAAGGEDRTLKIDPCSQKRTSDDSKDAKDSSRKMKRRRRG
jgi:hypothetical protein